MSDFLTIILDERENRIQEVLTALGPAGMQQVLAEVGRDVGIAAEGEIPDYPRPRRAPLEKRYTRDTVAGKRVTPFQSKFKSAKQAYYVLQLGKSGGIPYHRTGQLQKSITSGIRSLSPAEVVVSIGTNVPYAPLVIGRGRQASYHAGHWWTLEDALEKARGKLARAAQASVSRAVTRLLNAGRKVEF